MQKFLRQKIMLLFLLLLPFSVLADTATQQLGRILDNLHSMQAQFVQTVSDGHGQIMQQSSGEMALARPGKFRWDTKTPSHQLLIADGQQIWFYDKDLQQVTLQNQHATRADSPALLLDGSTVSLTKDFKVSKRLASGSLQIFKLTPRKADGLFQNVYLSFKQNQLQQMRLIDNLGQETLINFSRVSLNPALNSNLFRFVPPKGVDVVTQ